MIIISDLYLPSFEYSILPGNPIFSASKRNWKATANGVSINTFLFVFLRLKNLDYLICYFPLSLLHQEYLPIFPHLAIEHASEYCHLKEGLSIHFQENVGFLKVLQVTIVPSLILLVEAAKAAIVLQPSRIGSVEGLTPGIWIR